MKFAFFGYDYSLDVLLRLVHDGHEVLHIFSFPCDNMFFFNDQLKDFARQNDIPLQENTVTSKDIQGLCDHGCKVFLACGYPYKVPPIDESAAYGINMHPALLPRARSLTPIPFIIMHEPEAAGMTLHKMTQKFDAGDILIQKPLKCDAQTDVETLSAQGAVIAPDLVADCFSNLGEYWKNATPQDDKKASNYPPLDEAGRTLDWYKGVDDLLIKGRALGRYGVLALLENASGQKQKLAVYQFSGWKDSHDYPCGYIIRSAPREIIISVKDGFLCLKDFQVLG
tara:strand:+ start:1633 stop:2481 length:849 start_codon:yes stop_codon:yes gene_type:complete